MLKTLTAGLMALSLTLVPAAPVQAQQSDDALQRALVGLLAAGAVGLAIRNSQDNNNDDRVTRKIQPRIQIQQQRNSAPSFSNGTRNGQGRALGRQTRQVDLVPGRCFRRVETTRGGFQGVYLKDCLDRRYSDARTLPGQCQVRVGGRDGSRRGYDASCLRDFGYRSDRRWN